MLRTAVAICGSWIGGDIAAQWYEYHSSTYRGLHFSQKIIKDSKDVTTNRSMGEIDSSRTVLNGIFGLMFACPLLLGYQRIVIPQVFGKLERRVTPTLFAIGAHQLFLTPVLLFSYFTFMTACRGGFRDTSFMNRRACSSASQRYSIFSIQTYIFEDVIPLPLLCSWAFLIPTYTFSYYGGNFRSSLFFYIFSGSIFLSWCGLVSFTQKSMLL